MQLLIQVFSSVFFVLYVLTVFVWPGIRVYRQTGINPVTFGNSDSAHDLAGRLFKLLLILAPATILCYCTGGHVYALLLPAYYLESVPLQAAGMVICVLSGVWTRMAQHQMRQSWRVGIDREHGTELVTGGLFRYSRNPVFLGMLFTITGFFLLLPNAVTLVIAVAGYILVQVQIRLEEAFLLEQHGSVYADYLSKIKRRL